MPNNEIITKIGLDGGDFIQNLLRVRELTVQTVEDIEEFVKNHEPSFINKERYLNELSFVKENLIAYEEQKELVEKEWQFVETQRKILEIQNKQTQELEKKKKEVEEYLKTPEQKEQEKLALEAEEELIEKRIKKEEARQKKIDNAIEKITDNLSRETQKWIKNAFDFLTDSLKSAYEELEKAIVFDSGGAYYTAKAFETQTTYGFSDAQNYAFSKALEKTGVSESDYLSGFYYDESGEVEKRFNEFFELYEKQYEEMEESGYLDNIAQMKEKFELLQSQFETSLMEFFVENGETIMWILNALFEILNAIFSVIKTFTSLFGDAFISDTEVDNHINEIINGYTNNTQNNTFHIQNTMNANQSGITNIQQLKEITTNNYQNIANSLKNI